MALQPQIAANVAFFLGGHQPRAAIHQLETARTLHQHLQQLAGRGELKLGPAGGIIAIGNGGGAQHPRAMGHIVHRLPLQLFRIGWLGLLRFRLRDGRCQHGND